VSKDINDEDIQRAAFAALGALGKTIPGHEKYEIREKHFCGRCDLIIESEGYCDRCEKVITIEELDCDEDDLMNYMNEALEVIHSEPTGMTGRYLDGDEWKEEIKNPDVSYANRNG